jgi:cell division protease FtsH
MRERPYAQETQRLIDGEVVRLLREAEERATKILEQHRDALDELTRRLLDEETVDGGAVYEIAGRQPPA